jgi:hypothetical protein
MQELEARLRLAVWVLGVLFVVLLIRKLWICGGVLALRYGVLVSCGGG